MTDGQSILERQMCDLQGRDHLRQIHKEQKGNCGRLPQVQEAGGYMTRIHKNCGGELDPMDYSVEQIGINILLKDRPEFLCKRCNGIVLLNEVDHTPFIVRGLGMRIGRFPVYIVSDDQ
jgi:hypothetical protein